MVFLLFFLLIILQVLLKRLVELLNPPLDATKMEGLTALLAIPNCRPLVDRILTDDAFLGAFCQTFHKEDALLRQVFELIQKVFEQILDLCFVSNVLIFSAFEKGNFILSFNFVFVVTKEFSG